MKIAILGFTKVSYMPYLHFYLGQINQTENDVSLIYWKRDEKEDAPVPNGVSAYAFCESMSDALPLWKKLPKFYGYRRFAIKALKKIKPDFVIVLHSTTGITVLDYIKKKYAKKYIFDYRDVTYESNSVYRKMVASLAENSALTFTSSDGFRKFLPSLPNVLTSHNITRDILDVREELRAKKKSSDKVRIGFWGLLRSYDVNLKMIEAFGDDERFELHYYGRAQGKMLALMDESVKKYSNVFFHGEYKPKDRAKFAWNTDLIHNLYDNNDRTMRHAMANKYYDGISFFLPQLCSRGTFMAEAAVSAGIGLSCDVFSKSFADEVYGYFNSLEREDFCASCDIELERIMVQVEDGESKIKEVLDNANKQLGR